MKNASLICTKWTTHFDFPSHKGLQITPSDDKKKKKEERKKKVEEYKKGR